MDAPSVIETDDPTLNPNAHRLTTSGSDAPPRMRMDAVQSGGQVRNVSVLTADVRGFTAQPNASRQAEIDGRLDPCSTRHDPRFHRRRNPRRLRYSVSRSRAYMARGRHRSQDPSCIGGLGGGSKDRVNHTEHGSVDSHRKRGGGTALSPTPVHDDIDPRRAAEPGAPPEQLGVLPDGVGRDLHDLANFLKSAALL